MISIASSSISIGRAFVFLGRAVIRAGARPIETKPDLCLEREGLVSIDDGPMRDDDGLFSIEASAINLTASPFETIEGLARIDERLFEIDAGFVKIDAGLIEIDDESIEIDAGLVEIDDEPIEIDSGLVEAPSRLAAPLDSLLPDSLERGTRTSRWILDDRDARVSRKASASALFVPV